MDVRVVGLWAGGFGGLVFGYVGVGPPCYVVQGLGFRVWGLGFLVGLEAQGSRFGVVVVEVRLTRLYTLVLRIRIPEP